MSKITQLSCLEAFRFNFRVRVRVSRIWRPLKFNFDAYDGIHFLLDEHGTSIHAVITEEQHDGMSERVIEGQLYDIYQFSTRQNYSTQRVGEKNNLEAERAKPTYLIGKFYKLLFLYLILFLMRVIITFLNTDFIILNLYAYGCIMSVKLAYPQFLKSQNRSEIISELTIENLRRETLKVTLWGDVAKKFDPNAVLNLRSSTLAVITSLKLCLYGNHVAANTSAHTCVLPDHPTVMQANYKTEFSRPRDKVEIRGEIHNFDGGSKVISVKELTGRNPQVYDHNAFLPRVDKKLRQNKMVV